MLRAVALAAIVLAARAPSPAPANSLTDAWQKILTANASGLSGVAIGTVSPTFEDPFIVTRWPGLMTPTPSSLQGSTNSPTPPDSLAIDCRSSEHCMHHGSCNAARTACICNDGYLTHDPPAGKQCNYERKSQKTAFLYSLFLGLWGVDHFYIGNNGMAVGKLILGCASVFPLCCSCVLCACRKIRERHATRIAFPALVLLAAWVIWSLVDVIRFGTNWYEDPALVGDPFLSEAMRRPIIICAGSFRR